MLSLKNLLKIAIFFLSIVQISPIYADWNIFGLRISWSRDKPQPPSQPSPSLLQEDVRG